MPPRRLLIPEEAGAVDLVFILFIVGLYAASHWLAWAISRLGGGS